VNKLGGGGPRKIQALKGGKKRRERGKMHTLRLTPEETTDKKHPNRAGVGDSGVFKTEPSEKPAQGKKKGDMGCD